MKFLSIFILMLTMVSQSIASGMFIRNDAPISKQQWYQDALLTTPTTSQSVLDNAASNFVAPFAVTQDVENSVSKASENPMRDSIESVDIMNKAPGMSSSQHLANLTARAVGTTLNPLNWLLAIAGGKISILFAPQFHKEIRMGFGIGLGVGFFQALYDNYNSELHQVNWAGFLKDSILNGVYGVLSALVFQSIRRVLKKNESTSTFPKYKFFVFVMLTVSFLMTLL